ncbi:MAG: FHA domain-containing protein [Myxococcota bacterium]
MGVVLVEIRSTSGDAPRRVERQGAVQIGRGPDNDLVLADPEASWRHALVYLDGPDLWVRDLGSRNGTLVDGEKIAHPTRLNVHSRLTIGPFELAVRSRADAQGPLLVEDVATGVLHPIIGERFVIGSHEGAHLLHPGLTEDLTILLVGHGEVWAGSNGEDWPIALDTPFEVEGRSFVVRQGDAERVPTVEAQGRPYAYHLEASLDRGPGPTALLSDPVTSNACTFSAETRAVLLYTLGRQILEDRKEGVPASEEGWVADPAIIVSVWGRTSAADGRARLKTLVHRVRHDCRSVGLDPWCLEKRSGYTRLRADSVFIPGESES